MKQNQIQDRFVTLANNSCYALCLIEWLNRLNNVKNMRGSEYFYKVIDGYKLDYIDYDGTVTNPAAFLKVCDLKHRTFEVTYCSGPNKLNEVYPTFYSIDGKNGHFVLTDVFGVVWNPLSYSKNVTYGKQTSYRKIDIIG